MQFLTTEAWRKRQRANVACLGLVVAFGFFPLSRAHSATCAKGAILAGLGKGELDSDAKRLSTYRDACAAGDILMIPGDKVFLIGGLCDFSKQIVTVPSKGFGTLVFCAFRG